MYKFFGIVDSCRTEILTLNINVVGELRKRKTTARAQDASGAVLLLLFLFVGVEFSEVTFWASHHLPVTSPSFLIFP